ncbi:PREDICTED: classical arabinogalactan protein 9-like [Nicotiana attenuata]|uniref:classical arabinogalactan protein 9-like n=1 Tax=Nicotiana attenuata TaxID=49451 RepID=UPI000904F4FD|nr:PREDICTED: classical arabinogalactan protein 9-like [Nicotiana attenuata]
MKGKLILCEREDEFPNAMGITGRAYVGLRYRVRGTRTRRRGLSGHRERIRKNANANIPSPHTPNPTSPPSIQAPQQQRTTSPPSILAPQVLPSQPLITYHRRERPSTPIQNPGPSHSTSASALHQPQMASSPPRPESSQPIQ